MDNILVFFGLMAYLLILVSLLTGLRVIKVKFQTHKRIGMAAFALASAHGLSMLYFTLF